MLALFSIFPSEPEMQHIEPAMCRMHSTLAFLPPAINIYQRPSMINGWIILPCWHIC